MSKIKIKRKTKTEVRIFSVTDNDKTMQCWCYQEQTLFEIDGQIVRLSNKQIEKLLKFIKDKK